LFGRGVEPAFVSGGSKTKGRSTTRLRRFGRNDISISSTLSSRCGRLDGGLAFWIGH